MSGATGANDRYRDERSDLASDLASKHAAVRQAIDRAFRHWTDGDVDAALASCREALAIDPDDVDALAHTGTILWLRGDPVEAGRHYLRAHALAPGHVGVLLNIATLHNDAGDLETSLRWIEKAEALRPDARDIAWRKGLLELAMGDYAQGWKHYEAGLFQPEIRGTGPGFPGPPWDGSRCDRLVLWHEQGLGDTVQFVRYARLCRERASRVIVLCPTELVALIRSCPFVDDAVDTIAADDFERHVSIMSLPSVFATTLATVPADIPYLFAEPARTARWAARTRGAGLKVGLVWAGNFRQDQPRFHVIDRHRNMPLTAMRPLLELDGIAFYSLQKGAAASQAAGAGIVDFMDEVRDFADTAALIANLDLVISVDTSVVHVAGAMGKPVWVLSRLDACWRWLRNRPDSPWYPTATVYGQRVRGDWSAVIDAVLRDLRMATSRR